ncbi:MAG: hypothetical protein U0Y82_10470 [Thermoleophilia bacterium]
MRSRAPIALSAVAAVALLAGCGGATNDYRGKVSKVENTYKPQATALLSKFQSDAADPAALAADLRSFASLATRFGDDVEAITPPKGREQLAAALVTAERHIATAAGDAATAASKRDAKALQASLARLEAADTEETNAVNALNAAK